MPWEGTEKVKSTFRLKVLVLKNGDFFSALPGLGASALSGRVGKTCESSLINLIVQKIIVKNISPKIFLFKKIFVT